jgi:micrococcal nuclease
MVIADYDELMKCDKKNTSYYTLDGHVYTCKCVSVYDGDSITVVFKPKHLDTYYKYTIRLAGIDTPEIRTKNADEKSRAIFIRDFLREKVLNKILIIECGKFDKYGRLLADVFIYGESQTISQLMLEKKYAYVYNGGTKQKYIKPDSDLNI